MCRSKHRCPLVPRVACRNPGKGAFFWNFKMESGYLEWDFLEGVKQGWINSQYSGQLNAYSLDCSNF